ncbi:MAG: thiosulfate oxidation carrier complex protein SoxZ, partial [Methylophilaceae bacterium]
KSVFDAVGLKEALKSLAISNILIAKDLQIVAPDKAENGAIIQIEANSLLPNTEAIYVLVDKNPTALLGKFTFKNGAQPFFVTRIKMAETSDVTLIAKVGNQFYSASKKVEVLENGCGGSSSANEKYEPSMKLRAKLNGDITEVKAIIIHPMHTGQGKDEFGQLIPAHFIQIATVTLNEKPVLEMELGTGISKNPYLTFHVKGAKVGDKISVTWLDNLAKSASGIVEVVSS